MIMRIFLAPAAFLFLLSVSFQPLEARSADSGPDSLIEAAIYASRARRSFGCPAGRFWAARALQAAREYGARREGDSETSAAFIAQTEIWLVENGQRLKDLNSAAKEIQSLIHTGRLESANLAIYAAAAPACDGRFAVLQAIVNHSQRQAEDLARRGRNSVTHNPKTALALYERARRIDSELGGLDPEISFAKAAVQGRHLETVRRWRRRAAKATIVSAAVAAAGAVAYYGEKEAQRRQAFQWK